ncbi:suppressor of lurcher protein 1-like [Dermatophagoides farinae]|uniref:Suppressor of lurcher protein 1-like n=1 Tax=Dermatophagoides farinae TaxID=6954 RepID=A0A9D4P6P3_DERFA|nr:suppressor of lurcher protein 1-like [Dermatophagoides farinae]
MEQEYFVAINRINLVNDDDYDKNDGNNNKLYVNKLQATTTTTTTKANQIDLSIDCCCQLITFSSSEPIFSDYYHHHHHNHHHETMRSMILSTPEQQQQQQQSLLTIVTTTSITINNKQQNHLMKFQTGYFDLWYSLILLSIVALLWLTPIKAAIRPSCRCIIFDDTFGKEYGVFTSPDWPVPYEDNIDCLLYTFIAQPDHIVEITFDEFDVQKSLEITTSTKTKTTTTKTLNSNSVDSGCDHGDYVKLFLHLNTDDDNDGIDETTVWNPPLLCGKFPDIEQTHFSSNSILIFEFHTDWRSGNNTGFRGTFRFLKKAMFRTDGQLISGTSCDYRFDHESLKLIRITKYWVGQRGYFFSPQYPSTYPKRTKCSYRFRTNDPNQRVRLLFVEVSLQRDDQSCISNSDVIQIYDGIDSNADLIQQICGHIAFLEILSSTNQLYVEFISPPNTPKQQSAKGFKAEYSFIPVTALIQPGTLSLSPFTPPLMNYFPSSSSSSSGIQYPWLIGE